MQTYRELLRVPEYIPLFAAASCNIAGATLAGLALATLVLDRTGSPLLAAVSMFGPSFGQVLGATTLLSAGDRLPPRGTMVCLALVFAAACLTLAVPGLGVPVILAVVLGVGFVDSVGGAVRWGLVTEILPEDGYVLGRSVLNMGSGVLQIAGYGVGALLLHALSPRVVLVVAAGAYAAGALVARFGLTGRPPRAAGRPSLRGTWRVNRWLLSDPDVRRVYLALWVPNGLIVGAEALFVPYARASAGTLFMAEALGMLVGDTVLGRFVDRRRYRLLVTVLPLLLAGPYLLFVLRPALPVAALLAGTASVGFGTSLLLQDRLVALIPSRTRGQALGLHSSGMLTMQAVAATVAGAVAEWLPVGAAMSVMAVASILVTLALAPGLRRPLPPSSPVAVPAAAAGTPAAPVRRRTPRS